MMKMTKNQAENIARLMSSLRPEWDYPGCFAAVAAVKERDPFDVTLAATRLAATPEAKTPGALRADGQHWRERVSVPAPRQPPRRGDQCGKHPGEWADSCRGCAADKLAGDDTNYNPRRTEAGDRIATLRGLVSSAKARLCPCGVEPMLCADHDPRKTKLQEDA